MRAGNDQAGGAGRGVERGKAVRCARNAQLDGSAVRGDAVRRAPNRNPRNDAVKRRGERRSLAHAVRCALDGVAYTMRTQQNFRIQLGFALAAALSCWFLRVDAGQAALVALCAASVLAAECANTALESVVDLVTPEYRELARRAKDCAAGAVLVLAVGSVAIALLVFTPALATLFGD